MKKGKLLLPIFIIPIVVISIFILSAICEYSSVYGATKHEKDVEKFLKKEHGGKYSSIQLIDTLETSEIRGGGSCDGSTVSTPKTNNTIYYYSVNSDADNVKFYAAYDSKKAAFDFLSCKVRTPSNQVTDNLKESRKLDKINKTIEKYFQNKVSTDCKVSDKNYDVFIESTFKVNRNVTKQDYDNIIKLQEELALLDLDINPERDESKADSVNYYSSVKIKFNNVELLLDTNQKEFYAMVNHNTVFVKDSTFNSFVEE